MSTLESLNLDSEEVALKESILIVDDDQTLRLVIGEMLSGQDFDLTMAANAEMARDLLQNRPFSVVICDVRMPGESGVDLLRWAKQRMPDLPFIMMTGHAEFSAVADALNLGAHHFLQKPFRPLILLDAVNGVLRSTKLQKQNEKLRRELASYNARLRQEVIEAQIQNQQLFFATLTALTNAIDARDAYTCAHSTQVSRLAVALARQLKLDLEQQNAAEVAGQLHDIGKIAIPEQILLKPSRLTEEEFTKIMEHPVYGARILEPLPDCELILPAVRHHHERYDGTGYPAQMKGEDIPVLARVVAVCDTWSAMRTNRPYRPTMPYETALEIISKEKGRQFDPEIAAAFIDLAANEHILETAMS